MKTIIKTAAFLFLFGSLLASCNKSKEENADANLQETNGHEKYADSISSETDRSNTAPTSYNDEDSGQSNGVSSGNKSNKKGEKMSAADGTDKENHDGDMYTKNDTTRMPSGTTIK